MYKENGFRERPDAEELIGTLKKIDPQTALKVAYIRFSMYANYYVRYNASVVARGVREETVAAIREHAAELKGVDIAQDYVRRYNNAEYFCHILGYTGSASTDEIEALNAAGGDYVAGDIIGKAGIENSMELYLHGTRGSMSLYVNNFGQIQQVADVIDAKAGDDIYLTIDADLQMATYHLLEQKLAGILMAHMKNEDVNPDDPEHFIPLKQAYYQMIGNNVLDIRRLNKPLVRFHDDKGNIAAAFRFNLPADDPWMLMRFPQGELNTNFAIVDNTGGHQPVTDENPTLRDGVTD